MQFQSTLLVRGATLELEKFEKYVDISIHAPRERSDGANTSGNSFNKIFQSTLLVRGATIYFWHSLHFAHLFQSTLLVRGATNTIHISVAPKSISIHAPRERSDAYQLSTFQKAVISIHAPRERSDCYIYILRFYIIISIHAPRERSDRF